MSNFEVFISFKHHDRSEKITQDYMMAKELKNSLQELGLKVFFSESSLREIGASNYKRAIDNALDTSKILVVVGTKTEYINSDWVRYEWDGFVNDIISGIKPEAKIYFLIDGLSVHELPRSLRQIQGFQYEENGICELVTHIKNAFNLSNQSRNQVTQKKEKGSSYSYSDSGEKQRLEYQAVLESKKDGGLIREICEKLPDKINVLDLGCSAGFVTHKVFSGIEKINKLIGIDKFEKCVNDFEKEKTDTRFSAITLNAESETFTEELTKALQKHDIDKFDLVYASLSLHHLSSTKSILKKLRPFIRKGGYIYIRTCDDGQDIVYPDENNAIKELIESTALLPTVSDRYHGRKLLADLQHAGFSNITTVNYCIDTVGKSADERYCLFCNSFKWRKNYFKHNLDISENTEKAISDYNKVCETLEHLEEKFYEPTFYYCYNIPIFIANV